MWRRENPDPYITLLSEYMLQQTQASRVQSLLPPFLKRFPTIESLASASNAQVLVAWHGLGYNSRALRLRDCAREIVNTYNGRIPADEASLRSLPGIGHYTASALRAFAFHQKVVVIDVNIERIARRVFALPPDLRGRRAGSLLTSLLSQWQGRSSSSRFYQALMDLGAMRCKAKNPDCAACPLQSVCASAFAVIPQITAAKKEPSHRSVPNRLWRGRCVELLRSAAKHRMKLWDLEHALLGESNESDRQWLATLLTKLERDGLVSLTGDAVRLAD